MRSKVLVLLLLGTIGCQKEQPVATVDTEKAIAAEEDLFARRDAMLTVRQKVREQREKLQQQLLAVREKGSDAGKVNEIKAELKKLEANLGDVETGFITAIDKRITKLHAVVASSSGNEQTRIAAREVAIAGREGVLARREKDIARREGGLAKREGDLAKREKETCGGGGFGTTIIQTVEQTGSEYSKQDVDPLLKKARQKMSRKGVMRSDLPAPARGLETEATRAMRKGNYSKARFAAAQLIATIDSIRINKGFIATKINRLNGRIRGKKLKPATQQKVDKLFRGATSEYGDGRFSNANRKLNQIYAAIRR